MLFYSDPSKPAQEITYSKKKQIQSHPTISLITIFKLKEYLIKNILEKYLMKTANNMFTILFLKLIIVICNKKTSSIAYHWVRNYKRSSNNFYEIQYDLHKELPKMFRKWTITDKNIWNWLFFIGFSTSPCRPRSQSKAKTIGHANICHTLITLILHSFEQSSNPQCSRKKNYWERNCVSFQKIKNWGKGPKQLKMLKIEHLP